MKKTLSLLKLFDRNENFLEDDKSTIPIKTRFIENKNDID